MSLRKANIVLSIALLAFAAWIMYLSTGFRDPRTGQIPMALGALIAIGAIAMIVLNLVPGKGAAVDQEHPYADVPWVKWATTAGALALYAAGLRVLGFYESGAIFLAAISYLLTGDKSDRVRALRNSVVFGIVGAAVLWLMFDIVLGIPTEAGILI